MDQPVNQHGYVKPLGGFVVVLFVAIFVGGWLYVDAVRNELEMKIASLQSQLDAARMESKRGSPEPKKIAAEGTYVVEHEVLPAPDGEMPNVISRVYRVMTGGERALLHRETAEAEELNILVIEGRKLILTRQPMDASYGPCECDRFLEQRTYEALDLDDPAAGLKPFEPTPAIAFELQSRHAECLRMSSENPVCNE